MTEFSSNPEVRKMEIHGSYLLLYGVGIVLMIVNIIQSICRPKGKFLIHRRWKKKEMIRQSSECDCFMRFRRAFY